MVNHAIDPPNAGSRTPGATAVADDLRSLHRWAALLSESAQGMRFAAGTPACAAAIAQSLGCVEAALSDLEQAVAEMEAVAGTTCTERACCSAADGTTSPWLAPPTSFRSSAARSRTRGARVGRCAAEPVRCWRN